jgi:hypothetical protein
VGALLIVVWWPVRALLQADPYETSAFRTGGDDAVGHVIRPAARARERAVRPLAREDLMRISYVSGVQ